jgi:hypothetical protein
MRGFSRSSLLLFLAVCALLGQVKPFDKVDGIPPEWSLNRNACIGFRLLPPGQTGVEARGTFVESSTKAILGPANLGVDLTNANGPRLCVKDFEEPGRFVGVLTVTSKEKPEGFPITLTILQSKGQYWGLTLLFAGTALFWYARVRTVAQGVQAQELLPALLIRDRVNIELALLTALPQNHTNKLTNTIQGLRGIALALEVKNLDAQQFLSPEVPAPWATTPRTTEYKQFLDRHAEEFALMSAVVRHGILPASKLQTPGMPPAKAVLIEGAISSMDNIALAQPKPSASAAASSANNQLLALQGQLSGADGAPPTSASVSPSVESVQFQFRQASAIVWVTWAILTIAIGSVVLIFNKPDFGVPMDLLNCFVWGFGLPVAGQALGPGSATTAIGINLPK